MTSSRIKRKRSNKKKHLKIKKINLKLKIKQFYQDKSNKKSNNKSQEHQIQSLISVNYWLKNGLKISTLIFKSLKNKMPTQSLSVMLTLENLLLLETSSNNSMKSINNNGLEISNKPNKIIWKLGSWLVLLMLILLKE